MDTGATTRCTAGRWAATRWTAARVRTPLTTPQYPNHAELHFDLSANAITGTSTETGFLTITLRNIENATGTRYDDTFTGNHRHNVLNGGPGSDTVDYSKAGGAAVVNLADGRGHAGGGFGSGVTLISIENVTGSPHDDTFVASSGHNRIDGGDGIDTVYYHGPANSVRVTVNDDGTVTVSGGQATGDTLDQHRARPWPGRGRPH